MTAIQLVTDVQDLMPQTVTTAVLTPTGSKDTVDVTTDTTATTALIHMPDGQHTTQATAISHVEVFAMVLMPVIVRHVVLIQF